MAVAQQEQEKPQSRIQSREQYVALMRLLRGTELDDRPQVKLSLAKEAQAYALGESEQQRTAFAERIDLKPSETPSTFTPPGSMAPGGVTAAQRARSTGDREAEQRNADVTTGINNAREAGFDVTTGAPTSIRAKSALLRRNPEAAAMASEYLIGRELEQAGIELPPGVPAVFVDENSGRLAYWRPQEDGTLKPTLMDPAGADLGEVVELAPGAVSTMAEVAAAFGGAMAGGLTGSPAASIAGGATAVAATSAAATWMRKEMARKAGIPDEIVDNITTDDMLYDALVAGGFEAAAPIMVGGIRMLRNTGRPLDVDADTAKRMKGEIAEIFEKTKRIYEKTGEIIVPGAGGITGSSEILAIEATGRRLATNKESKRMTKLDVDNNLGIVNALNKIQEGSSPGAPAIPGPEAARRGAEVLTEPRRVAGERLRASERSSEELFRSVDDVPNREVYTSTQAGVAEAQTAAIENERTAWEAFDGLISYDRSTGVADITLANPQGSPIRQALSALDDDGKRALSESIARSQQQLARDLGLPEQSAEELRARFQQGIMEGTLTPEQSQQLLQGIGAAEAGRRMSASGLDMHQLHKLSSFLRRQKRLLDNNINELGWTAGDLNSVLKAVEGQSTSGDLVSRSGRRMFPDDAAQVSETYMKARSATRTRHDTFDRDAIRKLTEMRDDGTFVMQPNQVGSYLLTPDSTRLADSLVAAGHNPSMKAALLGELERKYANEVMPDGVHNLSKHRAFLDTYSDHINLLGGGDSTALIRNAADMGRMVQTAQRRAENVGQALRSVYGRTLSANEEYGGNIVRDIMAGDLTLGQTAQIRSRISRADPELWGDILRHGREEVSNMLSTKGGLKANLTQIDRMITRHGDRLGILYGRDYVSNLTDLRDVMRAYERTGLSAPIRQELQTPMLQMFRVAFGPLGREQRFITGANRLLRTNAQNSMIDMASDPQALDEFVRLGKMRPGSIAFIQGAMAAGMGVDELPQESQRVLEMYKQRNPNVVNDLLEDGRRRGVYAQEQEKRGGSSRR